jgi:hypothetical protein
MTHTYILGRTHLDKESVRRRDLYVTTHNTHKRETSLHPAGFEPEILGSERPQSHELDRAATATGVSYLYIVIICNGEIDFELYVEYST